MSKQIANGHSARRGVLLAALALGALIPAAAVLAAVPDSTGAPQVTVKFADLDLASDAGAATLLRRIETAARQVCGNPHEIQPLARGTRVRLCNAQAMADAVAKVGAPKVTLAYHARHSAGGLG